MTNMLIRGTKTKPEKQDIVKRRACLAGQASPAWGKATLRRGQPRHPGRACRGSQKQNHLNNHSAMTQIIDQCGVKPQSD